MKNHNQEFHSQLERSTDSFSLISEYFGRCLFDDLTALENELSKSIIVSAKSVVPSNHTTSRLSPKLAVKTVQPSTNPFDEDDDNIEYDDNKNPFKDDYDESKNPFADDL